MATAEKGQQQQDRGRQVWDRIEEQGAEVYPGRRGDPVNMTRLARAAGTDRSNLYRWKNHLLAGQDIGADALDALNDALQLTHGELRRLYGKPAPALPGVASPVSVAILGAAELEQHEKEALLRVYESFMANHRGDE